MNSAIAVSIFLCGFTAIVAQIILTREFLTVFCGNEISIGFILAGWFIWGAIGSGFLAVINDKVKSKIALFSSCQLLLSLFLPLSILLIRLIKLTFGLSTGEIIAITPMALSSFIILALPAALLGFMFTLGCRIYQINSVYPYHKTAVVYILEATGSLLGGLLSAFLFIRIFNSMQIIGILVSLNTISVFLLQVFSKEVKFRSIFRVISAGFVCAVILMWGYKSWDVIHRYSLGKLWRGYELLTSINSIYGNICVTKKDAQRSFFNNGLQLYTLPDELTSEESAHLPLSEHSNPSHVLLIGGGSAGLMPEILKHPIEKVDYVELDPLIIKLSKEYLPQKDTVFLKDPRVDIKNSDGRLFVKTTLQNYDCVIIHLGDPHTAQLNRYYTVEFFREVKRILKSGGIISFAVTSSENYISFELGNFLRSIYFSLKESFVDVFIVPGDTAYFLACDKKKVLTYDYKILLDRLKQRNIEVKYVREYYLFSKLSPERINYIENILQKEKAKLNYDFQPVSYYYDLIFWTSYFEGSFVNNIFKTAQKRPIWEIIIYIYLFLLLSGIIILIRRRSYKKAPLFAAAAAGFSEAVFQVVILFSFQIIYGYVFYKMSLIFTFFMIGLALGAFWMIKFMRRIEKDLSVLIITQAGICVYSLLLPLFFRWLASSKGLITGWIGVNFIFPFLSASAGFFGGFQFILLNKLYLKQGGRVVRAAGATYAMDLVGSCLGALLTAVFLVPVLGIPKTCLMIAGINAMVLIFLVKSTQNN